MAGSYKIADGYIEIHGRRNRSQIEKEAREAGREGGEIAGRESAKAADEASQQEGERRARKGGLMRSLFTPDPKLLRALIHSWEIPASTPMGAIGLGLGGVFLAGFVSAVLAFSLPALLGTLFIGLGVLILANNKKIIDSFDSMRQKVYDSLNRAAAPLIGPILGAIKLIETTMLRLEPTLKRVFAAIAPAVIPLTAGLLGFVEEFIKTIEPAMPGIADILIAVAKELPGLGAALAQFFAIFADNKELIINTIPAAFGIIKGLIIGLGAAILLGATYFSIWIEEFRAIKTFLTDTLPAAWSSFTGWLSGAVEWAGGKWGELSNYVSDVFTEKIPAVWSSFTAWLSGTWSGFTGWLSATWSSIWTPVVDFMTTLPGRIMGAIASIPGLVSDLAARAFLQFFYNVGFFIGKTIDILITMPGVIGDIFVAMWNFVRNTTVSVWTAVINFIASLPGRAVAFFTDMRNRVVSTVTSMWGTTRSTTTSVWSSIIAWISGLPGRISSFFSSMRASVVSIVSSAWNSARSATISGINSMIAWVSGLPGRARSALSSAGSALYGAGRNLISGMISGVKSAVSGLVSAVKRAMASAIQGAKDALGISSPSKVFEIEVGHQIMTGAQRGIEKGQPPLVGSIVKTFGQLAPHAVSAPAASSTRAAASGGSHTYILQLGTRELARFVVDAVTGQPGPVALALKDYERGSAR